MITLMRDSDGSVWPHGESNPLTHEHFENEISHPNRTIDQLMTIARYHAPDMRRAVRSMRAWDDDLNREDAEYLAHLAFSESHEAAAERAQRVGMGDYLKLK